MFKSFLLVPLFIIALVLPVESSAETLVCQKDEVGNSQSGNAAGFYMNFYEKFRNDHLFAETRPLSADELECLIKPPILEEKDGRRPLLVDIRDQSRFGKYRMANSINIPWHQLKRKAFLKERHIVLVDEGYRYIELLENCAELKRAGFKHVSVLEGGLGSLLSARHSEDDYPGKWISPREFYVLKFKAHWIVIDVSGSKNSEGIDDALYKMELSDEGRKLQLELTAIFEASSKRRSPRPNFLIVGRSGEEYRKIKDAVSAEHLPYVYFLKGGLDAYNGFIVKHQRIIAQKKHMRDKDSATCGG